MRRVMMMLAAMAMVVLLSAAAAYAATITGTERTDELFESNRDDRITARAGADEIDATDFTDDTDRVRGNRGADTINIADGDILDTANGGKGTDTCTGDFGERFISCEIIVPPV
jgi:Ca2+-binding RTX toxin-like protein